MTGDERIPLGRVEPGDARAFRLRTVLVLAWVGALVSLTGVLLPWHAVGTNAHLVFEHGGGFAFGPPALVLIVTAVAWNNLRFGWLLGWGFLVIGACFAGAVAILVIELSHLFDNTTSLLGLQLYFFGGVIQFVVAVIGLIAAPIEIVAARRELEADRVLPRAVMR